MKDIQTIVALNRLRFYAYHGALPQEQEVGGHYEVSLRLTVNGTAAAVMSDDLNSTVNYAEVYEIVRGIMSVRLRLLEHVAGRIMQEVFLCFRQVERAEIKVCKINPPIGAACAGAEVTLTAVNPWRRPIRLLVLDFDGTLADTATGIVSTMSATFKALQLMPLPSPEAIRQTIGLPLREAIARLVSPGTNDTIISDAVKTYGQLFERIGVEATVAFPGVVETLNRIASLRTVKIAIATSRGHASVEALCHKLGLAPYIDHYIAEDDVVQKKPHPEAVEKLMAITNVQADETLVVGDTVFDIKMGKAANCRTCGVTYGNHAAESLATDGADILANRFEELKQLFQVC